jgi:hypothetical protein
LSLAPLGPFCFVFVLVFCVFDFDFLEVKHLQSHTEVVTNEPIEFEKIIGSSSTLHENYQPFKGIYGIYLKV